MREDLISHAKLQALPRDWRILELGRSKRAKIITKRCLVLVPFLGCRACAYCHVTLLSPRKASWARTVVLRVCTP